MPVKPLAFIDSGIGGLPYLERTRNTFPNASYIYAADNLGFPYGTKTEAAIIASFSSMVERVIRMFDPQLFVVACNTASIVALKHLRDRYPYDFIGVVPAIKPAGIASKNRSIAVLATERTIQDPYLQQLITDHAADCRITKRAATELIQLIEDDPFMEQQAAYELQLGRIREELVEHDVDTMVLGCTHFLHLEQQFKDYMGSDICILDSRDGVARQVERILLHNQVTDHTGTVRSALYLSGPAAHETRYEQLAERYKLSWGGILHD